MNEWKYTNKTFLKFYYEIYIKLYKENSKNILGEISAFVFTIKCAYATW